MPSNSVLTINVGSSSVKTSLFVEGLRRQRETISLRSSSPEQLFAKFDEYRQSVTGRFAVGHRIVHGGTKFTQPTLITPEVLAELDRVSPYAPLHMPPVLKLIRTIAARWPELPQVACFDTAFHATMPTVEQRFGLPRKLHDEGIRKYGFHGLSYQYIAKKLSPAAASGRTVVCHLGSGSSLCGMLGGKSITTTMGFSPLDGLLMGTRCGRIDPGVLLYLLKQGRNVDEVQHLLEAESGLLGVSGFSADMRELLASDSTEAQDAISLYCHLIAKEIGSAAAALGGLDAIVFTAGIGENCPTIRKRIADSFTWLGAILHNAANDANATKLHGGGSRVELWCIPTDEEAVIDEETRTELNHS